jgi:hypothetical protein
MLVMAAGVAQAALLCRIAVLRSVRRGLYLELIVAGGAALPLPSVGRLCRQLLDGRTLERLASSIEEMIEVATRPSATPGAPRPLADARVIRSTAPKLRHVASLLRNRPAVRGVALVEWLMTSPVTPLYGTEIEPLRRELGRALYLLAAASDRPAVGDLRPPPAGSGS